MATLLSAVKPALKRLYRALPFKQPLYTALRAVWQPPKSIHQHLHFEGVITVPVGSTHFRMRHYGYEIENEVFWTRNPGGTEPESMRHWIALCQGANTILDVGANTGIYALVAQALRPSATIVAFEPIERIHAKLAHNLALNQFPTRALAVALSDTDGTGSVFEPLSEHFTSVTVNENHLAGKVGFREVSIPLRRLDTLAAELSLPPIDLMKIDVETHEPAVLRGMGRLLTEQRPDLLIELLNDDVAHAVQALVADLGYRFYNVSETAGTRRVERLTRSDSYNFLLLRPASAQRIGLA